VDETKFGIIGRVIVAVLVTALPIGMLFFLLFKNGINPFDLNAFIADPILISPSSTNVAIDISKIKTARADSLKNIVWAFGSTFGLFFAVVGIVNSIYRTEQKDREIQQTRRATDSDLFSNAVTKLGAKEPEIQVGGLYELEFLAKLDLDNKKTDASLPIVIKQTLANFIRLKSKLQTSAEKSAVETALVIISNSFSKVSNSKDKNESDLGEYDLLNLSGVTFNNYKFPTEMNLNDIDFSGSVFLDCTLNRG